MENNKFDKRTMNIRTGLGLLGIQVDLKVAYLVDKFMIAYNWKGEDLTLDELTDIKFKAEKFFNGEVDKPKMTLEDLRGIAINCKTRKESDKVLKLFDKLGAKWAGKSPDNMITLNNWHTKKNNTCYIYSKSEGIEYDEINYFKDNGYTIKSAQWFIDNFTPKDKEETK